MTALDPHAMIGSDRSPAGSEVVPVNLASRSYEIHIGVNLLERLGDLIRPLGVGRRLGLVTHPILLDSFRYAPRVLDSLAAAGYETHVACVPEGEASKSLDEAGRLAREMVAARLDRGSAILGLGGGVVGDLAGFVAAILFRGIPFINLPTTLLAQMDSSIGGKTGVNLPEGKNLVGAFHQPRLVVADVLTLRTLPDREFRSGMAEVVKHAMIADARLFASLEVETGRILARDPAVLQPLVARSCAIKARVVEADEREGGIRAILNFGHTVGHALEAALGYGNVTHGEAVAFGMLLASELSVRRGLCPRADAGRLRVLLGKLGLLSAPIPPLESLEKYIVSDKKMQDGVIQFVLTRGVGSVTLAPVSDLTEIRESLQSLS